MSRPSVLGTTSSPALGAARARVRAVPARALNDLRYALWLRKLHRDHVRSAPPIPEALASVTSRWSIEAVPDQPVVLLSAGWRSGSTFLQRVIMGDGSTMVWGEPYHRMDLVRSLADGFRGFTDDWPGQNVRWLDDVRRNGAAQDWVADLYPDPADLVEAHRALFRRLFADPARDGGFPRWGFKEVRLDASYAGYLKLLFPNAKLIFLVRNPYRAYESYRRMGSRWYDAWPDRPVFGPSTFGRVWNDLTVSFRDSADALGARFVRYEDLAPGSPALTGLLDWLEVGLDSQAAEERVTPKPRRRRLDGDPWRFERMRLRQAVGATAADLGYREAD